MRYLVTGGAGFIGSHLVTALLAQGADVRVLDNFSTGTRSNLEAARAGGRGRLEVVETDIRDAARVASSVEGVDIVFHEAAFVSVPASMDDPATCFKINCDATAALLESARLGGVRRVVLASSAAVYGDSERLPLSEDGEPKPLSPYAASKLVDEVYASVYTCALRLEVCALRYFNVFGPRQRPDTQYAAAVPIFIRQLRASQPPSIFGDGTQTRDLIFVGDVVRANLVAAEHRAAPGQVLNVCTGRSTRVLDLVETLCELIPGAPAPKFSPPRAGDILHSVGNPARAREVIGFEAKATLREGLRETAEWMQ